MKSMTRTLILANLFAFTLIQLVAGTLFFLFVRQGLTEQFDNSLEAKLDTVIHLPELEGVIVHGMRGDFESEHAEIFASVLDLDIKRNAEDQFYLQIVDGAKEVYRSPTLLGEHQLSIEPMEVDREPKLEFFVLPNGNTGRSINVRLDLHRFLESDSSEPRMVGLPDEATFVLAQDATGLLQNFSLMRWTLVIVGIVVMLAVSLTTYLMTKRSIQPLSKLAQEIEQLNEDDSSQRVEADVPIELSSIKARLNEYLDKIQSAFQRERQFSDDVAHELRTPLAGIIVKLEHAQGTKRSDEDRKQALVESRQIAGQLDLLVRKLLELSRLETAAQSLIAEKFDVAETLKLTWASLEPVRNDFQVNWNLSEHIIKSDLTLFIQLMTNIFNNAQTYVDANGNIEITCVADAEGQARIEVSNSGNQLSKKEASQVFSRLWRGDKARAHSNGHLGLGLAIAEKIAQSLQGKICVDVEGTKFRIAMCIPSIEQNA